MTYFGEHLFQGTLGNFFIVLSFVSALLATVAYAFNWNPIGRWAYRIHSLAVIGITATLFYMLYNHMYEYEYVWHHSSSEMRMRYIFSCFWEGQEGSFLLWSFWNVVLGNILMRTAKDFEGPVMALFGSVQTFLSSMILGIYAGNYKIGSNPFTVLLRQHPDYANIPLFQNPHYLDKLDGRGLNPLLQNYWMTIHPPTLFLGFALTLVPFVYAIAGLWKRRFNDWQVLALPWIFVGVAVLGTGILMGGAWAYEALSFGGFWAWDPVENSSLVPWLILVGAGHVILIHKHKGKSLFSTYLLSILSFILVLYSTFLTRSGILGESSVHAFTDLGMSGQLLVYLFFYIVLAIVLLVINHKVFYEKGADEALWSREFWMFLGSLVLLVSAFHIIFNTSLPVWNKLFSLKMAPPSNAIAYYNSWQVPFAILICFFMGFSRFLKFKDSPIQQVVKSLIRPVIGSVMITVLIILGLGMTQFFYVLLLWAALFCCWANFDYWIAVHKGKLAKSGASIAHAGFAMIVLGALISTSQKTFISKSNQNLQQLDKQLSNSQNILITKGDTLPMGNYYVTYAGKHKVGVNIFFKTDYFEKQASGKLAYLFTLNPKVQTNPKMGNVAEPDTKHFLNKDIYTHITYADLEIPESRPANDSSMGEPHTATIGLKDTITLSNCFLVLTELNATVNKKELGLKDSALAVGASFEIIGANNQKNFGTSYFVIENNRPSSIPLRNEALGFELQFTKINPESGKFNFVVREKNANQKDFIVMEGIIFPYINILWTGSIVMVLGTLLAVKKRLQK